MRNRLMLTLLALTLLAVSACATLETAARTPTPIGIQPTFIRPTPTDRPAVDPSVAQVGRWQWTSFSASAESYPPVQVYMDVADGGVVSGRLSIYPNSPEIPQSALTLIQQNGCNLDFESLDDADGVSGVFYSPTEARLRVNVGACTVKFYGGITLEAPVAGEFAVSYDEELTQMILHPRELTPIERGQRIFSQYCSACHGSYGEGMPGTPSLHEEQVRNFTDAELDEVIRNGRINTVMPAWGNVLSPEDFAGVIELVRNIDTVLPD